MMREQRTFARSMAAIRGCSWALVLIISAMAFVDHARAGGRIVFAHDVNTFSTNQAGAAETRFALNVADWLCYGQQGRILLVQSGEDAERDYSLVLVHALQSAGFGVVVSTSVAWTAPQLAEYDAVFVGIIFGGYSTILADELRQFVEGGGGVYCFGGVGALATPEAESLNPFAAFYGLSFADTYNLLFSVTTSSAHPIFEGVPSLNCVWGPDISVVAPQCGVTIIQRNDLGGGVYAAVDTAPAVLEEPLPVGTCPSGSATFSVAAGGSGPFTYQWQWQPAGMGTAWVSLTAGDNADASGTPIVNASNVNTSAADLRPLAGYTNSAPRAFRCSVSSLCSSVTSNEASLTVCAADFDCNGTTNGDDFDAFLDAFQLGEVAADIDGNGFVNGDDFDAYIAAFVSGC